MLVVGVIALVEDLAAAWVGSIRRGSIEGVKTSAKSVSSLPMCFPIRVSGKHGYIQS
jgi:hypothetical protein